ncbi:hypothetical protein Q9L58_010510 [Maublancomyces gigas]|uniref:SET domain-containing protein n=1 Tax=Discina gigas TaxID=1032678 RepID=A0ABR3G3Y9_9PEZI
MDINTSNAIASSLSIKATNKRNSKANNKPATSKVSKRSKHHHNDATTLDTTITSASSIITSMKNGRYDLRVRQKERPPAGDLDTSAYPLSWFNEGIYSYNDDDNNELVCYMLARSVGCGCGVVAYMAKYPLWDRLHGMPSAHRLYYMGEDQELDDKHYTGNELTNGIENKSDFPYWETSIIYKPRTGKERLLVGTDGTPGVMMNHMPSKAANCRPIKVELTNGVHLQLWFQATQHIDAHAELTWDYGCASFFDRARFL